MMEIAEQGSEEPDPGDRRHGALEPADDAARSWRSSRAACRGRARRSALPLTWIEQRLAESGLTIEQLVQSETQQQAADQVSISNSIGSLRFLGAMDWREFVETMSVVEQKLREDPGRRLRQRWISPPAIATGTSSSEIAKSEPPVRKRGGAQGDPACAHESAARTSRRRSSARTSAST